ncbi:MAG: hypothetical protein [Bacteriophage sp.]|nr:MAG: hypothetical protein [Bacteriophage sp.]
MATTPNQKPVPSEDYVNMRFNAGKLDEFLNSSDETYTDRLGADHLTQQGIKRQALSGASLVVLVGFSFQSGATITANNQALLDTATGEYFRWDGPIVSPGKVVAAGSTTPTIGEQGAGKWVGVGDASLRYSLINSDINSGDALIKVILNTPGALERTQHSKNADYVSIFDFPIVSDGSGAGGTDNTDAINLALAYCASTGKTLNLDGAKLFTRGRHIYNFKKHAINGGNATFFVSEDDDAAPVFYVIGHTAPGTAIDKSAAYSFDDFSMYPGTVGVVRTNRDAFSIGDASLDCGGAKSDNIYLSGFRYGLTFGSNSYIHNFTKWTFTRCDKGTYYPSGLSNSGENINFNQCVWANSTTGIDAGGDCVINVTNSSFDYTPEKIYAHAGGIVKCDRCWFEGSDDDSIWIHTLNQLSTVILDKCTFILAGNRSKYLFDGATAQGGILLIDPMITTTGNPTYSNPTWGTGFVALKGTPVYRRPDVSNDTIPFSSSMNNIVSPNFNLTLTDSMRSDFTIRPASAATTTRNETTSVSAGITYNSSSNYLVMQPPVGNVARITRSMLAAPGCSVTAGAYVASVFGNTTDQLDLNIYFKNAAGVVIAVYNKRFNSTNANSIAKRANVLRGIAAPQGTAFIEFEITTTNPAIDGSSLHEISNLTLETSNGTINLPYDTTQSPATGFIPYVYGATTPGAGTYTVRWGSYTLVGNLVFINMQVTWTGHTGTGQVKIGALPYLTDFPSGELMNVLPSGITTTGRLIGVMDGYSNSMIIDQVSDVGGVSPLQMPTSGSLHITGIYRKC